MNMPLSFRPIPKPKVWGGERLSTLFAKDFLPEERIGESWEIADYGEDISVVDSGRLAGHSLNEIVHKHGSELMGKALYRHNKDRFPLLLKLIDTGETLSVQVHPSDEDARRLRTQRGSRADAASAPSPTPLAPVGKIEAWYVLHAEPGAVMYHGLRENVTREALAEMLQKNQVEQALRTIPVKAGDVLFCPPGTVHAIGKGLVLVEIQRGSETTLRLFDWNRAHDSNSPRPLHIKEALEVITFGKQVPEKITPTPLAGSSWKRNQLVFCDAFEMELWSFDKETAISEHGALAQNKKAANCFEILACMEGKATLAAGHVTHDLARGGSLLIPAALDSWTIAPEPKVSLLHITAPR